MKSKLLGGLVATILALPFVAHAQLRWNDDLNGACEQAVKKHEVLLIDCDAPWCPYCHVLQSEVFASPRFAALARNNLVLLRFEYGEDGSSSDDGQKFAKVANIDSFPTVFLFDEKWNLIDRFSGYSPGTSDAVISRIEAALKSSDEKNPQAKEQDSGADDGLVVVGIDKDDTLAVRSGPGSKYSEVVRLASGTRNIKAVGSTTVGDSYWIKIEVNDKTGWVNGKYVGPAGVNQ
jgi:thioredoxin-related protein